MQAFTTRKQIKAYHYYMPIKRSAIFSAGQLNITKTGHNEWVLTNTCFQGCHFLTQPCILVRQITNAFRLLYVRVC